MCLAVVGLTSSTVVAFTTNNNPIKGLTGTGARRTRNLNNGFRLGPIARNGLAYEDVTIGQGRRILPGDTVYCYYQGSFTTKGQGLLAKTTTTVFDEISTSQSSFYRRCCF